MILGYVTDRLSTELMSLVKMSNDPSLTQAQRTTMVDTQVRPSDVTKFPIIDALLRVPREDYVPEAHSDVAYAEATIPLSDGRELMETRCFAKMLDATDLSNTDHVLIIGGGLGYSAAVIGTMAGSVVMVEEDADMATVAERTLSDAGIHNVAVLEAGLTEGAAKAGPYDVIFIEGSIEVLPQSLADQLKDGGRVATALTTAQGCAVNIGHKSQDHVSWRPVFDAQLPVLDGFAALVDFAL